MSLCCERHEQQFEASVRRPRAVGLVSVEDWLFSPALLTRGPSTHPWMSDQQRAYLDARLGDRGGPGPRL
jgi:hypothetical protein